uniref:Uncharacterized protein n=1 Tax=Arundo donax TaxID=35708 RepID=A0A0A9DR30_ARUDO
MRRRIRSRSADLIACSVDEIGTCDGVWRRGLSARLGWRRWLTRHVLCARGGLAARLRRPAAERMRGAWWCELKQPAAERVRVAELMD